jgi:hypothetical protein
VPVVIRVATHSKDRRKALQDALQSVRVDGRTEPFPPNKSVETNRRAASPPEGR